LIFGSHNQGVPGSCPGGPTELNSTVSRVYEVKFVNPFYFRISLCQVPARFCVFGGKTGVKGGEGMELENIILFSTIILKYGSTSPTPSNT